MALSGGKLGAAQLRLFGDQPSGLLDIARHENCKRDPEVFHDTLVERCKLRRTLVGKLELAPDFLGGELGKILIDDVADMFEVDAERDDFHGAASVALIEAAAGEPGDV